MKKLCSTSTSYSPPCHLICDYAQVSESDRKMFCITNSVNMSIFKYSAMKTVKFSKISVDGFLLHGSTAFQ